MNLLLKRSMQTAAGRTAAWGCVYSTTNQVNDLIPETLPSHSSPRFGKRKKRGQPRANLVRIEERKPLRQPHSPRLESVSLKPHADDVCREPTRANPRPHCVHSRTSTMRPSHAVPLNGPCSVTSYAYKSRSACQFFSGVNVTARTALVGFVCSTRRHRHSLLRGRPRPLPTDPPTLSP